jgi:hypothetical protein
MDDAVPVIRRAFLNVVAVIAAVLWVVNLYGPFAHLGNVRIGR